MFGSLPNGDAFILVKAANTGIEHDPSCVFFSLDARHTGLKGYASGVVRITTEGDMAVRLGIGMTEILLKIEKCLPCPMFSDQKEVRPQ